MAVLSELGQATGKLGQKPKHNFDSQAASLSPNLGKGLDGETSMAKTTEQEFGLAVMQVLASEPGGEADVRTLIARVPEFIKLTEEDQLASDTRKNEEMWEQQIRNLKSHDKTAGNVIAEGFVEHVSKGRYRLTDAGRLHLKNKGLA